MLIQRPNWGEGQTAVASDELPQWNKVNKKPVAGLTRRRVAELQDGIVWPRAHGSILNLSGL